MAAMRADLGKLAIQVVGGGMSLSWFECWHIIFGTIIIEIIMTW